MSDFLVTGTAPFAGFLLPRRVSAANWFFISSGLWTLRSPARYDAYERWFSGDLVEETTETNDDISTWLEQLRTEHRDLDDVVNYLLESGHSDLMQVQRLKKRKLRLKDMIARLESRLIPDLDA